MNGSKTIENRRIVGGDYFHLQKMIKSNLYLKDFINKFNFDDYWCFNVTNIQKLVSYEEFLEFKYSGYIFFKKDLYNVDEIVEWIRWSKVIFNGNGLQYLNCPTPPFPPQKIIIRK